MKKHLQFHALKHRDFRLFWGGSFISQMGDQMQIVAVAWQLYAITHNAASLGLVGLSSFVPLLIFSLIGGVYADKVNRRKLLVVCQISQAVLAFILFFTTQIGTVAPWIIYLVLAGASLGKAFNQPARQSVFVNLVPREIFINAVSLNTLQRQSAIIIGPAIAGFMISFFGVQSVYLFNALSFLAFLIMILVIHIPPREEKAPVSVNWSSIKEGIVFVGSRPIIYSTMVLDFLATFFGTANILMPIFATDILKVGAEGLGLLYSAPAVGGMLAGLYFSGKHKVKNQGKIIIGAILIYGAAIVGFSLSRSFYLSLAFLAVMGMGDMVSTIVRTTLRQLLTPDYIRGRMVSINSLFSTGGPKLGDTEAGFLAHAIGAPFATLFGGLATIILSLAVAKFVPSLLEYRGSDDNQPN